MKNIYHFWIITKIKFGIYTSCMLYNSSLIRMERKWVAIMQWKHSINNLLSNWNENWCIQLWWTNIFVDPDQGCKSKSFHAQIWMHHIFNAHVWRHQTFNVQIGTALTAISIMNALILNDHVYMRNICNVQFNYIIINLRQLYSIVLLILFSIKQVRFVIKHSIFIYQYKKLLTKYSN